MDRTWRETSVSRYQFYMSAYRNEDWFAYIITMSKCLVQERVWRSCCDAAISPRWCSLDVKVHNRGASSSLLPLSLLVFYWQTFQGKGVRSKTKLGRAKNILYFVNTACRWLIFNYYFNENDGRFNATLNPWWCIIHLKSQGYLEIDWNECDVMNRFSRSHVLVDRYCTHTFERVFCLEEEGPRPLTTDVTSLQKGEADTRCTEDRVRVSTSAAACSLRKLCMDVS